jgi:hypothetical protein
MPDWGSRLGKTDGMPDNAMSPKSFLHGAMREFLMAWGEKARRGLAILMMACFFLPLAECSKKEDVPVESVGQADRQAPGAHTFSTPVQSRQTAPGFWDSAGKERFFPAELPVSEVAFWVWLGLLGGPLGCAILRGFAQNSRLMVLPAGVEIGLEACLLWFLCGFGSMGWKICWGGMLAALAAILLALAAVRDLSIEMCRWWARRNLEDGFHNRFS